MKTITKQMQKKTSTPLAVKLLDSGVVEGYAAIFGNVDRVGDRVMKGAFGEESFTLPLLAYHDDKDPVGSAVCTPDDVGLKVVATFADTARSQEIRALAKAGAIPAFSFGYRSLGEPNDFGGEDIYKADTMEVSLTPIPANPLALVTAVKSMTKQIEIEQKAITGSYEARSEQLYAAIRAEYASDRAYPWIRATFDDQIIYEVYDSSLDKYRSFRVGYVVNGDGSITFGEPDEVKIEEQVSPVKAALGRLHKMLDHITQKAGARHSKSDTELIQAAHDSLVKAGAVCDGEETAEKDFDLDSAILDLEAKQLDTFADRLAQMPSDGAAFVIDFDDSEVDELRKSLG